ncbi:MAG: GNAT family N-acetyltransferase [Leptolyngbyaceae cyanobacterium T60_A2020_046]|nr:GNAT family N-acetyltransferase [Leptolyngbyaceae cyanobacterium T60_A2020_046]
MELRTARLQIRDWAPMQDAAAAIAIYGDPAVTRWLGNGGRDESLAAVRSQLERYRDRAQNGLGCWAVVEQQAHCVIGTVLLVPLPSAAGTPSGHIEIGWHFRPASWGHGFATEAAQAVLAYGFEVLRLPAIYAVAWPDNQRSMGVMQRLGMTDQGLSRNYYSGREPQVYRRLRPPEGQAQGPRTTGLSRLDGGSNPNGCIEIDC